jgi:hypothetical protein
MEGSCSTGQSPQWAVVPVEEEEEEEGEGEEEEEEKEEPFLFQFAIQKYKHQDLLKYNFTCCFVWV